MITSQQKITAPLTLSRQYTANAAKAVLHAWHSTLLAATKTTNNLHRSHAIKPVSQNNKESSAKDSPTQYANLSPRGRGYFGTDGAANHFMKLLDSSTPPEYSALHRAEPTVLGMVQISEISTILKNNFIKSAPAGWASSVVFNL